MIYLWLVSTFLATLYLLPAIIGVNRNHKHKLLIVILNTLLGWTGVGWLICLIWSLTTDKKEK